MELHTVILNNSISDSPQYGGGGRGWAWVCIVATIFLCGSVRIEVVFNNREGLTRGLRHNHFLPWLYAYRSRLQRQGGFNTGLAAYPSYINRRLCTPASSLSVGCGQPAAFQLLPPSCRSKSCLQTHVCMKLPGAFAQKRIEAPPTPLLLLASSFSYSVPVSSRAPGKGKRLGG